MERIDCSKCKHRRNGRFECKYDFRWASNAGGRAVDCKEDVYHCRDYEEKESEDENYD